MSWLLVDAGNPAVKWTVVTAISAPQAPAADLAQFTDAVRRLDNAAADTPQISFISLSIQCWHLAR